MTRTKLTPPELAREWGVSAAKILHWIRSGELRAIDIARRRGGRPRYLIDRADIAAFEAVRQVVVKPRISRRRKPYSTVIKFF